MDERGARELVVELCRQFYDLGWVSGTGGGISVRLDERRVLVAPSGVQKERLRPGDLFVVDLDGRLLARPEDPALRPSACTPLFLEAYRRRGAGAVLHSHSLHAFEATLHAGEAFRITHVEMIKGIEGHGYHDLLEVPVIDNTAHEADLAGALGAAIEAWPRSRAVLVRRHGVYVWGPSWERAKTHAECYDYLFAAAARMRAAGLDPAQPPGTETGRSP